MAKQPLAPITVFLVDDHALVRESLSMWLSGDADISVVGSAGNADQAVTEVVRLQPDVVIMDIEMPGLLCFDAARTIRSRSPDTRIIFLSAFTNDYYIAEALRCEASGFLTKDEPPARVGAAVRAAVSGRTFFSSEVEARIVIDESGPRLLHENQGLAADLTPREIEVLRYLARGMSKREIAETMRVAIKTVDNHATNLMQKLDIHDRVTLALFAIRAGPAEP